MGPGYRLALAAATRVLRWRMPSNAVVSSAFCSYNFKNEAATFTYTYTQGAWTAEGKYDFAKDAPTLSVRRKQGKHTLQAVYGLKDEAATLSWEAKPFKLAVKSKAGRGGVSGVSASLQATKEFEF